MFRRLLNAPNELRYGIFRGQSRKDKNLPAKIAHEIGFRYPCACRSAPITQGSSDFRGIEFNGQCLKDTRSGRGNQSAEFRGANRFDNPRPLLLRSHAPEQKGFRQTVRARRGLAPEAVGERAGLPFEFPEHALRAGTAQIKEDDVGRGEGQIRAEEKEASFALADKDNIVAKSEKSGRFRLFPCAKNPKELRFNLSLADAKAALFANADVAFLPLTICGLRRNIEVSYYEQKTVRALGEYRVRSKVGVERLVNLLTPRYSAAKLLPYSTGDFCALRGLSPRQTRFTRGRSIRREVFFASLAGRPELGKMLPVSSTS